MQLIWLLIGMYSILTLLFQKRIIFETSIRRINVNKVGIIGFLFILGLTILMSANRTGYDALAFTRFYAYIQMYGKNPFDYTYEVLSKIIIEVLKIFPALTYPEFHAACVFFSLTILSATLLNSYAYNIPLVLSLYGLSGIMAQDGMQIKNFLAVFFLLLAIWKLLGEKNKKNILGFWIFLLIAIMFHFSFVIYVSLIITRWKKIKGFSYYFPLVGTILYFIFLIGGSSLISGILFTVGKIPFLSKVSTYGTSYAGIRSVIPLFIYLMMLFTFEFLIQKNLYLKKKDNVSETILLIWRWMGIFLPLLVYANAMYRLFRNLYIVVFMAFANLVLSKQAESRNRWISTFLVFSVMILIYVYPIILGTDIDIYQPIIEGEYFWKS